MPIHALSFFLTFTVVCLMVPLAALLARRVGLVDKPDARRKLHAKVSPLVGGICLAAAVGVAILLLGFYELPTRWLSSGLVLCGVGIVFCVGVVDDRLRISGKWKLLGQLVAAGLAVWGGVQIRVVDVFGWELPAGYLAIPLTVLWLVGASNSVNLLDGMDGMVGTVGLSMLLGMTALFALRGHDVGTVVTLAGAGALVGFLVFNLPPARIFMGDGGSLTLGLVLGILALKVEGGDGRFVLGPTCLALFFLPIADSCAAFTRRLLTGRSIFATDRGHLHHRLVQAGYSTRQVLQLVLFLNVVLAAGVVGREVTGHVLPLAAAVVLVTGVLVLRRLFGHTELMLVVRRVAHRLPIPTPTRQRLGRAVRVHIQGSSRVWDDAWAKIRGSAGTLKARALCLNISAPALHETYLARWESPEALDAEGGQWRADWPLRHDGQVIGRLTVVAAPCFHAPADTVAAVTTFAVEIERQITQALSDWAEARPVAEPAGTPRPRRLGWWRERNPNPGVLAAVCAD